VWVYDQFSPWYYDELSGTPGTSYVQSGNVVLALSGGAAQEWAGDYSQNVDVVLGIYSSTTQEFQAPGGPQAYTQAGNAVVLFYGDAGQTYIPPNAGQDGQVGNVVLLLSAGAYQDWRAGGNPGDVIQNADAVVTLAPSSAHYITLPNNAQLVTANVLGVAPFGAAVVVPVALSFVPATPMSRITMTFSSSDAMFVDGTGPEGGDVCIELATTSGGRLALVSVSAGKPSVEFFDGQGAEFSRLKAAIQAGSLVMEMRAFESLPFRVIGRPLGASSLVVETLP